MHFLMNPPEKMSDEQNHRSLVPRELHSVQLTCSSIHKRPDGYPWTAIQHMPPVTLIAAQLFDEVLFARGNR